VPGAKQDARAAPQCDPEEAAAQLHEAVQSKDLRKIRRLLGSGLDFSVDTPNEDGETAAVCAARSGDAEIVAALLDARADPLARDTHPEFFGDGIWPNERKPQVCKAKRPVGALAGKTVVYHLRLTKCFDKVLKRVFPMTRIAMMRAISAALQSFHNNPALIVAVQQGHSRLAAILLEHSTALGPSTATDSKAAPQPSYWTSATKSGSTGVKERAAALLVACTHRQWRCAEVVLEAGVAAPSLDITRDPSGRTAMHLAAAAGERTTVQLLLKAGASPAIFSCYGGSHSTMHVWRGISLWCACLSKERQTLRRKHARATTASRGDATTWERRPWNWPRRVATRSSALTCLLATRDLTCLHQGIGVHCDVHWRFPL